MFEGSEKKIEVIFSSNSPSLLKRPDKFWRKIVQTCKADIISCSKFPKAHSYLLSESSLFIWPHRLVFITCGKTVLSKSFIKILKSFQTKTIELCFFQRKNEFFPQIQKSCFYTDLKKILKRIKGSSYRFGSLHDHHFFLFHSETDFIPDKEDQTLEILIYDSQNLKDTSTDTISDLKKSLNRVFHGFEIQDHFFKPSGYSLNAVRDESYYTIHITPEKPFFYISFETNIKEKSAQALTDEILAIFKPLKFDFILFESQNKMKTQLTLTDYFSSSSFYKALNCGYHINYKTFHKLNTPTQAPISIKSQ